MNRDSVPLFPILSVSFIGTLGYSIFLPFLVFLTTKFGGGAIAYGVLGATYSVFQLFGAPVLGKLSDIHGRKKILLLSHIGTILSWVIVLIALMLPIFEVFKTEYAVLTLPMLVLFIGRALDGLTGGNISVANAYLADITDEENRKINYGKMSVANNLGFMIGPMLAGILGGTLLGEKLPVFVALSISIVAGWLIAFRLPDAKPIPLDKPPCKSGIRKLYDMEHKECYEMKREKGLGLKDIFKIKHLSFIMLLYFLMFVGFNIFYTAFPIHTVEKLHWSITALGIFFSVMSVLMILVQGPLLSILAKKVSDETLTIVGTLILSGSFLFLMSANTISIYIAAALFALGNGLMWPSFLAIISRLGKPEEQGFIQGMASSTGSLASIIGLILGGFIYIQIGVYSFLLITILMFIVFLLTLTACYRLGNPKVRV